MPLSRRHLLLAGLAAPVAVQAARAASARSRRPRPPMTSSPHTRAERIALPFPAVRLHDAFWSPKQTVYRERTIPHSWQYVQRDIEDNEIAAGWRHETRGQDTPWNQANLHKVLETCAYALGQAPNAELDAKLDGIIRAIVGAQQPNGYINALITVRGMTPWANLDGQHDGYVAGHLIEAAVAHYRATGKSAFLDVAKKAAEHIHQHFIEEGHEGVCGHAGLELALVRLYRETGNPRELELALNWIERRGKPWRYTSDTPRSYFMDHLPIREVPEVTGHAVRTVFYLTGVADAAIETGDETLKAAARRLWRDTVDRKSYVNGSVGSQASDEGFGPAYDLPNHGYNESCAACGMVYFADAMFRMDGHAESMDVVERVLYNAIPHGMGLDGVTSYYRNPLSDEKNPRGNIWVCCPPCLSRTLLRVQEYVYARTARDLVVNLYVASDATVPLPDGPVTLTQETNYPWDGEVKLTVTPQSPRRFAVRLRIPGWSRSATIRVNGRRLTRPRMEHGYAVLRREWKPGDVVELSLPMPVERMEAHPAVTENRGMVALQRGPLVYGFEGLDNDGTVAITLAKEPKFATEHRADFLGGVTVVIGRANDGKRVTAIPFHALANREPSSQAVWASQEGLTEVTASASGETVPEDGWKGRLYRPLASV